MASVEAVAASEAALEAAVDLSMTWRRCSDGSAAAAAGSTLAGIVALVSSHLLYECRESTRLNAATFRRFLPERSRQTDRQMTQGTNCVVFFLERPGSRRKYSSAKFFLVGVTNLVPILALIKIRLKTGVVLCLRIIFQLTSSFVYFCKSQTTKEKEIRRSTGQIDGTRHNLLSNCSWHCLLERWLPWRLEPPSS